MALVNITPISTIASMPACPHLDRIKLDIGKGVTPRSYLSSQYIFDTNYYFTFSGVQPISAITYSLGQKNYSISVDTVGSGTYDTELINEVNGEAQGYWGRSEWAPYVGWSGSPVDAYGVNLHFPRIYEITTTSTSGTPPSSGEIGYYFDSNGVKGHRSGTITHIEGSGVYFETSNGEGYNWGTTGWFSASESNVDNAFKYVNLTEDSTITPALFDCNILCEESSLSSETLAELEEYNNPTLESNIPIATSGTVVNVATPAVEDQYLKGVYFECWMGGFYPQWTVSSPQEAISGWPGYQSMIADFETMGINLLWWMPYFTGVGAGNVITSYAYGGMIPWVSDYTTESNSGDYLSPFVDQLHADGIKIFMGHRPHTFPPKSGVNAEDVMPGMAVEMVQHGVDGVALLYDESATVGSYELASGVAEAVHAYNPNATTFVNLMYGANTDIAQLGEKADVDLIGGDAQYFTLEDHWGHWCTARFTQEYKNFNPIRDGKKTGQKTIATQNTIWGPLDANPLLTKVSPPVSLYASQLSEAFHGAEGTSYWRYKYQEDQYLVDHVSKGNSMLDTLAAWGGRSAVISNDILVLYSFIQHNKFMAGDYVVRNSSGGYHGDFPLSNHTVKNNANAVYETLLQAGHPYNIRDMTYADRFPDLSTVKLIIVTSPSMGYMPSADFFLGTETYLQNAVDAGVKVVFLRRDEATYPNFTNYNTLISSPNASVINDNLSNGVTDSFRRSLLATVNNALGSSVKTYLNAYNHDIETAFMERGHDKFLLVVNWDDIDVNIDVGITGSRPYYRLYQRDINNVNQVLINGRKNISKAQLAKFRINLGAGEAKIFFANAIGAKVRISGSKFKVQ